MAPLQRVLHAAARLFWALNPETTWLTAALGPLYSLSIKHRVDFKPCLLSRLVVTGRSPLYPSEIVISPATLQVEPRFVQSVITIDFVLPRPNIVSGRRALIADPRAWNHAELHAMMLSLESLMLWTPWPKHVHQLPTVFPVPSGKGVGYGMDECKLGEELNASRPNDK